MAAFCYEDAGYKDEQGITNISSQPLIVFVTPLFTPIDAKKYNKSQEKSR